MYKYLLLPIVLWHFCLAAQAQSALIVEQPAESQLIKVIKQAQLTPVGRARFSVLFWDIYDSQLYSSNGEFHQGQLPLLFEIHYLTDISRTDLIARTVEQWQHLAIEPRQYRAYLPQLHTIWPDIAEGDRLALLVTGDKSTFYLNQQRVGSIDDPRFGGLFLDIWLSPHTSQPGLRRQLLGRR